MNNLKIIGLYYRFFVLEIPNFIQIFSLLTLFSILLKNTEHKIILIAVVSLFLAMYLLEKSAQFLKNQIIDNFSETNRHRLDDKQIWIWWTILMSVTIVGFALVTIYLSSIINL
jgi:hypothetical protein